MSWNKPWPAQYEYGPFGEPIRGSGTMAKNNPFRFSTKYTDNESGLVYYGYRFFNPSTGRWISRDPIGEKGGLNLYGFVENGPLMQVDNLGLQLGWPSLTIGHDIGFRLTGGYDPLIIEAYQMFSHLNVGDLGENYQLSESVIETAKSRVNKKKIINYLSKDIACNQSGTTVVRDQDLYFSIEEEPGFINMGNWQLRSWSTANWKCSEGVSENGKCCCECSADIHVKAFMSKTYTFRATGYNSYNSSLGGRIFNAYAKDMQLLTHWYDDIEGPAYFVSTEFDFLFSQTFKKCEEEEQP